MSASSLLVSAKMSKKAVDQEEYSTLVGRSLPHVIRNERENEHYLRLLEALDAKLHPTPAEKELADLLTVLIENFEGERYALKKATPIESLTELREAHGLKQKDLVDIFGSPSIVSEVLNGKRRLTTEHIRRLSERFHVSPELFV